MDLGHLIHSDDLVFATVKGKLIDSGVLSHNFVRTLRSADFEDVHFPDLRNTFANPVLHPGSKWRAI